MSHGCSLTEFSYSCWQRTAYHFHVTFESTSWECMVISSCNEAKIQNRKVKEAIIYVNCPSTSKAWFTLHRAVSGRVHIGRSALFWARVDSVHTARLGRRLTSVTKLSILSSVRKWTSNIRPLYTKARVQMFNKMAAHVSRSARLTPSQRAFERKYQSARSTSSCMCIPS